MSMPVKIRQAIEKQVVKRIVVDALAAGFQISVNDGEEITLFRSTDRKAIMGAVMTTDDDYLLIHKDPTGPHFGWVRLIYGNDGWDVVNDYSVNLEELLAGSRAVAEKLEKDFS